MLRILPARAATAVATAVLTSASLFLVGPVVGSADASAATQAARRANTSIRFLDFDHTRGWLNPTHIVGQVTAVRAGQRGAVKGVHVRLYRKLDGTSRFHLLSVKSTGTQAFPRFRFATRSIGNATYKVVFGGNASYQRSVGLTRVLVHRAMPAQLEDRSGSFHGVVKPSWHHKRVYLEKRSCASCGWHKVRHARTGAHGHFQFTVSAPRSGRWWWRASVPASTRFIRSFTGIFATRLS